MRTILNVTMALMLLSVPAWAVNEGTEDVSNKFENVVLVKARQNNTTKGFCSGILLAPKVVITAGHCVNRDWNAAEVKVGQQFIPVKQIFTLPDFEAGSLDLTKKQERMRTAPTFDQNTAFFDECYCADNLLAYNDIALLELKQAVSGDVETVKFLDDYLPAEAIKAFQRDVYGLGRDNWTVENQHQQLEKAVREKFVGNYEVGDDVKGLLITAVGFGCTKEDCTEPPEPMVRRYRDGSLLIGRMCNTYNDMQAVVKSDWLETDTTSSAYLRKVLCWGGTSSGDGISAHGDSGGPVFLHAKDGSLVLVSIVSDADDSKAFGPALYQLSDLIKAFIKHVEHPDAVKRGADACDRLAGSGVPYPQIDANPAVKACLNAVHKFPFDPVASFHLGRALYKAGAFSNALLAFHVAANAGVVPALFNIGFIYNFGAKGEINSMSVPEDDQEAAKWYRKAVDAGDVGAMNNLGVMYRKGQGVPQDEAEAMRLFQKAADAGNAEAKDNLKAPEQRDNTTPEQHDNAPPEQHDNAPPEQHDNGRDNIAD